MRYEITDYKLDDNSHIYRHENTTNGDIVVIHSADTNLLGTTMTVEAATALAESVGVESTTIISVPHVAHRFAHHFNEPKGQYLCYTSEIQDGNNTVLYYVLEQTTDMYVTFKTDNAHPNGIAITMEEINHFLTNYTNNGIPTVPSNRILKDFGHLLTDIT